MRALGMLGRFSLAGPFVGWISLHGVHQAGTGDTGAAAVRCGERTRTRTRGYDPISVTVMSGPPCQASRSTSASMYQRFSSSGSKRFWVTVHRLSSSRAMTMVSARLARWSKTDLSSWSKNHPTNARPASMVAGITLPSRPRARRRPRPGSCRRWRACPSRWRSLPRPAR